MNQEKYCKNCLHHVVGDCNVFLKDEELLTGCGDKVELTAEEITTQKGIEAVSNCQWKDPDKKSSVPRMKQGKCLTCKKVFLWTRGLPLYSAYCPFCGDKLRRTTYLKRWPREELGMRVIDVIEAYRLRKTSIPALEIREHAEKKR